MQGDHDSETWEFSPANFYIRYGDWSVEVGNVHPAFDEANLLKDSRIGVHAVSTGGDPLGRFYLTGYRGYGTQSDRMGVAVAYAGDEFGRRFSIIDPDQSASSLPSGLAREIAASGYYITGNWEFSAATAINGRGIDDNDLHFAGAKYAFEDDSRIGLNLNDNGTDALGNSLTLFGDRPLGEFKVSYYAAYNDGDWDSKTSDYAYGAAIRYDITKTIFAAISAQRDFDGMDLADIGVRFSF